MNTLSMFLLDGAAPQAQQGNPYSGLIMIAAIFVIFWLFFIRPQNKKQKEMQKFRDALQKGDKVITVGGIHGKVEEVKTTTVMISIDNNVKIEVEKSSLVANPNQVGQN
ncbi:MAG: preprotein translocase subunit YajC [Bacteroidales bacterium]|jgi:preprotein translocase subunit YajC|nr:preprotein translocase subunit YajC [Bacteroidales bacterium]